MASEVRLGAYTVEQAVQTPYLMERMGREIQLAAAVATIYPDAVPMMTRLAITDWPTYIERRPHDYPYRIQVDYNEAFIRFIYACEMAPNTMGVRAAQVMAGKEPEAIRDRYWEVTQELHEARQRGDQRAVIALSDERDVLSRILSDRGEAVGHSKGGNDGVSGVSS